MNSTTSTDPFDEQLTQNPISSAPSNTSNNISIQNHLPTIKLQQLKHELSSLQQQASIISTHNQQELIDITKRMAFILEQIDFYQIQQQLHHEFQQKQQLFEEKMKLCEEQMKLREERCKQEQLEMKLQLQEEKLQQQYEYNTKMLQLERREFELDKLESKQQQSQQQQPLQQSRQPLQQQSQDVQSSNHIHSFDHQLQQSNSTQIHNETFQYELIEQLLYDYESMKYLVTELTTTINQQSQQYIDFNIKVEQFDQRLSDQTIQINQALQINNTIEQERVAKEQQLIDQQKQLLIDQEAKRNEIESILLENLESFNGRISRCINPDDASRGYFHFEIHNSNVTCLSLPNNTTLADTLEDLNYRLAKFTNMIFKYSKIYISSKHVLNGEWIQIYGDGALVDIDKTKLFSFCVSTRFYSDGISFVRCDCSSCCQSVINEKYHNMYHTDVGRYLIRFKCEI